MTKDNTKIRLGLTSRLISTKLRIAKKESRTKDNIGKNLFILHLLIS